MTDLIYNSSNEEFKTQTEEWLQKSRTPGADKVALNEELAWIVHAMGENLIDIRIRQTARDNPGLANEWEMRRNLFEQKMDVLVARIRKSGIPNFNGRSSLKTYLSRAISNAFLDGLRSLKSHGKNEIPLDDAFGTPVKAGSHDMLKGAHDFENAALATHKHSGRAIAEQELGFEEAHFAEMLNSVMAKLPEGQRQAVLLSQAADDSGQSLAAYCRSRGMDAKVMKGQLFRARLKMKQELASQDLSFGR